jgi:hypothetical protein
MWQRAGGQRWMLGCLTHAAWAFATISAIAILLVSLSTKHYTFVWETTLLSPSVFVWLTESLGWLPSKLGFAIPDMETITTSGQSASMLPNAQRLWSGWLMGCIIVYGLVPRVMLCLVSMVMLAHARNNIGIDFSDPYYMQLIQRLQPLSQPPSGSVPTSSAVQVNSLIHPTPARLKDACVLTAIEPGQETIWPPPGLGEKIQVISAIDSRESRHSATQLLATHCPKRLAIAIDARHTPDRGTLRLIFELSSHAGQTLAWLHHGHTPLARNHLWQSSLASHPGLQVMVTDHVSDIVKWFESC